MSGERHQNISTEQSKVSLLALATEQSRLTEQHRTLKILQFHGIDHAPISDPEVPLGIGRGTEATTSGISLPAATKSIPIPDINIDTVLQVVGKSRLTHGTIELIFNRLLLYITIQLIKYCQDLMANL